MKKGMPGVQLLRSGCAAGFFVCTLSGRCAVFNIDRKLLKIEGTACFWKFTQENGRYKAVLPVF